MYAPQHSTGFALMERKLSDARRPRTSRPPDRHRRPRRRKVSRAHLAALVIVGLVAAGCSTGGDFERVYGSGRTASETRVVEGFDRITVSGGAEVVVDLNGSESLVVEAEDNLLDLLTVEVVRGDLRLGVAPYINLEPTRPIVYRISAARLEGVTINGSARVEASPIDTARFGVSINGSGRVVPIGTTSDLDVDIAGSGRFDGRSLQAERGTVDVSGSGRALVNVTDDLDASVSGSGHIDYRGDPTVQTSLSGSGSIGRG